MAFKLRSGNKSSFKSMGSSAAKQITDFSNVTVDGEDAKTVSERNLKEREEGKKKREKEMQDLIDNPDQGINRDRLRKEDMMPPPNKQKLNKGGEGQDQDKIFNDKGEHIGDYINDKPVMRPGFKRPVVKKDKPVKPKEGDMKKYSDLEKYDDDRPASPNKQAKTKGLGPRTAFGGVKNPELVKTKKTKSKKVMIDGPKKQVTGVKNPGNWQPSVFDFDDTFKTKKKK